jgi:hypothetical protein
MCYRAVVMDMRHLSAAASVLSFLIACASTTTDGGSSTGGSTSSSGGSTSGGSSSSSTSGGSSSGAGGATKTSIQRLCTGWCGEEAACLADAKTKCYAALASDANLAKLEACGAEGKCGVEPCGVGSAAGTAWVTKCKDKVGSCGGSIDGLSAGDCGDVIPLFRDDVIADVQACVSKACDDFTACLQGAIQAADPACSSL